MFLLPWTQKWEEQHSLAGEGVGRTQFGRLEEKLALCILSASHAFLIIWEWHIYVSLGRLGGGGGDLGLDYIENYVTTL